MHILGWLLSLFSKLFYLFCSGSLLEGVQADASNFVDVNVPDLGAEESLRGHVWVVLGQVDLHLKASSLVRGVFRAIDVAVEESTIVFVNSNADARHYKNNTFGLEISLICEPGSCELTFIVHQVFRLLADS